MTFECIKRLDGRRRSIIDDWEDWLREADAVYDRHLRDTELSPFDFHEVAAVGFLAASAARADFLTLNEYELIKRDQTDRRKKKPGRADLWLSRGRRTYSFECKRAWHAATIKNLEATLRRARGDIDVIDDDECHFAAGIALAYVRDEKRRQRYVDFAKNDIVDAAYRIGPDGVNGGYLYFSMKG